MSHSFVLRTVLITFFGNMFLSNYIFANARLLDETLRNVCSSEIIEKKLEKVVDSNLDENRRYQVLADRRIKLHQLLAEGSIDRAIKISHDLLPYLAINTEDAPQISKYFPESCSIRSDHPSWTSSYTKSVSEFDALQAHHAKVHQLTFMQGLGGNGEGLYKIILRAAYEKMLIQHLDSLMHHRDMRFGINSIKKIDFPEIYPTGLADKVGKPVAASNRLSAQLPILDRPTGYLSTELRILPTDHVAGAIAKVLFRHQQIPFNIKSIERFLTTGNGNQDIAPKDGFHFAQGMQWMHGKVLKVNNIRIASTHVKRLIQDLRPTLLKHYENLQKLNELEFQTFLAKNMLLVTGEDKGTEFNKEPQNSFSDKLTPQGRRLVAAWQLLLRYDLGSLIRASVNRTIKEHSGKKSEKITLKIIANAAKIWLGDLGKATKKICKNAPKSKLHFLEEHPSLVAQYLMENSHRVEDPRFLKNLDGYCNAGKARPKSFKNIDKYFAHPWGITPKTQTENAVHVTGTLSMLVGSLILHASPSTLPLFSVSALGVAVGGGLMGVGLAATTMSALSKTYHLYETLALESAMVNPRIRHRLLKQAGVAGNLLSAPFFAWSYLKIAGYITQNGVLNFLTPPGREIFKMLTGRGHQIAEGALGMDIMGLATWMGTPFAIGITARKFLEEKRNPLLEPVFWVDTFQTYLGLTLYAHTITGAKTFVDRVNMVLYLQASNFLSDHLFQKSLNLINGNKTDLRYSEFTFQYLVFASPVVVYLDTAVHHGIAGMFKGLETNPYLFWGNMVTSYFWEHILFGYPFNNLANSLLVDYTMNKELTFWDVWTRIEFSDFHLQVEENNSELSECTETVDHPSQILKMDQREFDSMRYLMKYYGSKAKK